MNHQIREILTTDNEAYYQRDKTKISYTSSINPGWQLAQQVDSHPHQKSAAISQSSQKTLDSPHSADQSQTHTYKISACLCSWSHHQQVTQNPLEDAHPRDQTGYQNPGTCARISCPEEYRPWVCSNPQSEVFICSGWGPGSCGILSYISGLKDSGFDSEDAIGNPSFSSPAKTQQTTQSLQMAQRLA